MRNIVNVLLFLVISAPATAAAQDLAAAEALFSKGLADMEAGRYDAACPAIGESYRLDPRGGTLFTLAECEAKAGKIATAVARYDDALFDRADPRIFLVFSMLSMAGALLNLLQNAYKYSGEDKRIAVRARRDDGHVVLEVEDHGVGIPRRELRRVFDRFYRVDTLLTRSTEGSGLGLSIAQHIVQAHGGKLSVERAVGRGSTFRIHLPVTSP